jgi:cysteine desulfurase
MITSGIWTVSFQDRLAGWTGEGDGRGNPLGAGPAIASNVGLPTNGTVYISLLVAFFKLCRAHWRNSTLGDKEISPLGSWAPESDPRWRRPGLHVGIEYLLAMIYADYNATTPLRPEARAAMLSVMAEPGNPSSVHGAGRTARAALERARRQVSGFLGANPETVIFTSGGTEADLLALRGTGRARALISAIEHDAVLAALPEASPIPVGPDGLVDLTALGSLLDASRDPAIVSVMWANNETGAIQPLGEVIALAKARGALVHSDAVQAAGKVEIDFASTGLDLMSVSAHKIGGPPGVGALLAREGLALDPLMTGGGQERGRRSGTENMPGIVGFGAAAERAAADLREPAREMQTVARLRDRFEARIRAAAPDARVLCQDVARLPNTSCVVMPGMAAETQVMALDLAGIAVSAGAACSSGKVKRSHVIEAMEPGGDAAANAIRVSLGWMNTAEEVDRLVEAWLRLYKRAGGLG